MNKQGSEGEEEKEERKRGEERERGRRGIRSSRAGCAFNGTIAREGAGRALQLLTSKEHKQKKKREKTK